MKRANRDLMILFQRETPSLMSIIQQMDQVLRVLMNLFHRETPSSKKSIHLANKENDASVFYLPVPFNSMYVRNGNVDYHR